MDTKEYVKQYENADLCSKWENNIPLSELSSPDFILITDSQEINSILGAFDSDFPDSYMYFNAWEVTGIIASVNDGDYGEVYVTESSRPYDLQAIYHPLSYYL